MIFNQAQLKQVSVIYDFARDGGGDPLALPTVLPMGQFCPINSVFYWGCVRVLNTCTSGGAATISVGTIDTPNRFLSSGAVATFTAGALLPGNPLITAPFLAVQAASGQAQEIVVRVEVAILTAGRFIWTGLFIEYPQTAI